MKLLQIKNHLFKMNGLGCDGGTQGVYFEKVTFRVRGGLVSGRSRRRRSADSKNLPSGYLTVTSKSGAKDMQKKHDVMQLLEEEGEPFGSRKRDWLNLKNNNSSKRTRDSRAHSYT